MFIRMISLIIPVLLLGAVPIAASAGHADLRSNNYVIPTDQRVHFRSGATKLNFYGKEHSEIFGQMFIPKGSGPFPAVILAHDYLGTYKTHREWGERLRDWGYAALLVDSFDPRDAASGSEVGARVRAHDLYGALKYLRSRQDIIDDKVAVIGWSQGGTTTLIALQSGDGGSDTVESKLSADPKLRFAAGVAYYPRCASVRKDLYSPLLVLIGDRDGESSFLRGSVEQCRKLAAEYKAGGKPVEFELYENATHAFDYYFDKVNLGGAVLDRNPVATEAAIKRIEKFLGLQLR